MPIRCEEWPGTGKTKILNQLVWRVPEPQRDACGEMCGRHLLRSPFACVPGFATEGIFGGEKHHEDDTTATAEFEEHHYNTAGRWTSVDIGGSLESERVVLRPTLRSGEE